MKIDLALLNKLHDETEKNLEKIKAQGTATCFCCSKKFTAKEIKESIKEKDGNRTVICPFCSVDACVPGSLDATVEEYAHAYWFGRTIKPFGDPNEWSWSSKVKPHIRAEIDKMLKQG